MPNNSSNKHSSDILGEQFRTQNNSDGNLSSSANKSEIDLLRSIDKSIKDLMKNSTNMSQSNASSHAKNIKDDVKNSKNIFGTKNSIKGAINQFTDSFKREMFEAVVGSEFKSKIQSVMNKFAEDVGVNIEDVPKALGKQLANTAINKFKETKAGYQISHKFNTLKQKGTDSIKKNYINGRDSYLRNQTISSSSIKKSSNVADIMSSATQESAGVKNIDSTVKLANGLTTAESGLTALGTGAAGAEASLAGIAAASGPLIIGVIAVSAAFAILAPAIDGTVKFIKKMSEVADRSEKSREERIKNAQTRLEADIKTMVEAPFDILKEAAEELYHTWDNNLRVINGTQGYNKDDLQTLIGNFSQRLRNENLTKVVSASSITDNLAKVLESGLSGSVAEEFAYLATKLNAAIPTQDFFSYAGTYSSLAANQIRLGKSQSEAIEYANAQLEGFASNILYASREISGGFTTGLKNAENLFTQSVQIAQASKTGDPTQISSVLTAVSAITGAIAPDLAQSMTDAIYKAATGGNSSEIVALRSLAGINASNTEFLKQLANDPQKVFSNLFSELAKRQNMSQDAYMEVAEGLSSIFGVSADAFARVDFQYLSQAISSMNSNNSALLDNMDLLKSGETTTNAEQLKMQQINEYMLEEGLSYVLDNQAARSIQENMWAEQRANKLMEATYGVELKGTALEFLEGIRKTIDNIITFLNPIGFLGKIGSGLSNLIGSINESNAQDADLKQLLELGKVGKGNAESLYQLTTRGQDLDITKELVTLMGGRSEYASASAKRISDLNSWNQFVRNRNILGSQDIINIADSLMYHTNSNKKWADSNTLGFNFSKVSSLYNWGTVGKSSAGFNSKQLGNEVLGVSLLQAEQAAKSNQSSINKAVNSNIQKFLGTMQTFLEENTGDDVSYNDWIKTASRFQIADFSEALKDTGLTEESIKGQFESFQTEAGIKVKQDREKREEQFWIDNIAQLTTANTWLESMYNKQIEFYEDFLVYHQDFLDYGGKGGKFESHQKAFAAYCNSWTDYYVKHTAYRNSVGYDSSSWNKVKSAENAKSRDAVYALAEALTKNNVELLDPTVQTNVLLAEILQIVNAIMQQGNSSSNGMSLPQSIAGLALGAVNT